MGGLVVPAVFDGAAVRLEILYGELDGTFPNHPADPIQPENLRDLAGRVAGDRRRRRAGLRRRRRPRVPRRRAGRGPCRARPPRRIVAAAMLDKHPGATILHNLICSKAVPEVIREHGGTPVRTRVGHSFIKAGDGRDRRRVRRRALGALLLPRQLPGRLRAHRRACSCSSSCRVRACRCRSCASRSSATPTPARSTPRSTTRTRSIERGRRRSTRRRAGPARRPHRRLRRLVVQPAPVEHRAAAAPQPRGRDPSTSATRHVAEVLALITRRLTALAMALDPQLLEILACPEDKGPLLYFEDEDSLYNPRLKRRYAIRDDIPIMLIDEAETVDDAEHERLMAKAEAEGIQADVRLSADARLARHARDVRRHAASARAGGPRRPSRRRRASTGCPTTSASSNVVVLGMGGSGIAGDVLSASPARSCRCRSWSSKGYELPGVRRRAHAGLRHLVLGQHRGDVEAASPKRPSPARTSWSSAPAASSARLAADWGAPVSADARRHPDAACRPRRHGHPAPARARATSGCSRARSGWVDAAVEQLARRRDQLAADEQPRATRCARRIGRTIPLIYGGGAIGRRGRDAVEDQVNENAKAPAFCNRCPSCATTRCAAGASTATSPGRCSRSSTSATTTSTRR